MTNKFSLFQIYRFSILFLVFFQFIIKTIVLIQNIHQHEPYILLFTRLTLQSQPDWILLHLWISSFFITFVGYLKPDQIDPLLHPRKLGFYYILKFIGFYMMILRNSIFLGGLPPFQAFAINFLVVSLTLYFQYQNNLKNMFLIISLPVLGFFFNIIKDPTVVKITLEKGLQNFFPNFNFNFPSKNFKI